MCSAAAFRLLSFKVSRGFRGDIVIGRRLSISTLSSRKWNFLKPADVGADEHVSNK
jgi:hypothetical protein